MNVGLERSSNLPKVTRFDGRWGWDETRWWDPVPGRASGGEGTPGDTLEPFQLTSPRLAQPP